MVSFLWRPWTTSKVGCRTATYSTSSEMEFGSSSVKTRQEWVHTYSTSPTTPTEGDNKDHAQDISRIRLGFVCDKARFYTCKGSFNKRVCSKHFCSNRIISGVDPTQRIQVLMLPDSTSTVAHSTTAGYFKTTHATKPTIPKCLLKCPCRNSSNTMDTAIRIDFTLCRGCTLYPQVGYRTTNTLVSLRILTKPLPTLAESN
jgi:hypothetical protein